MQVMLDVISLGNRNKQTIHLSSERVFATNTFQDFNTIFKLLTLEVELTDIDTVPLSGVLELTIGKSILRYNFTVLKFSKIRVKNDSEGINNTVITYKIIAIGIPFHLIQKCFNKSNSTLDDPLIYLKSFFETVDVDSYKFDSTNYFNANLIQVLHKIQNNIFFDLQKLSSNPVVIVKDDLSEVKIKDFFKLDLESMFVGNDIIASEFDEYNMYKSFNVNQNKKELIYNIGADSISPINISMDKEFNVDNQYYKDDADNYITDSITSLIRNNNNSNMLDLYENSSTLMIDIFNEDMLSKLALGNKVISLDNTYKLIGFQITTSYDTSTVGGMIQLSKI